MPISSAGVDWYHIAYLENGTQYLAFHAPQAAVLNADNYAIFATTLSISSRTGIIPQAAEFDHDAPVDKPWIATTQLLGLNGPAPSVMDVLCSLLVASAASLVVAKAAHAEGLGFRQTCLQCSVCFLLAVVYGLMEYGHFFLLLELLLG